MLSVWGLLLTCASASVSADSVHLEARENLTIKCSTVDCEVKEFYGGMYLYRDDEKVTYFDYKTEDPSTGQFSANSENNNQRIVKTGSFDEHFITIINVTVNDSGFYRCVAMYTKPLKFRASCNVYRVNIVGDTDREVCTPSSPVVPECPPAAQPFLVIIITATASILITMIFTLCLIPKIKHWSRSRDSRDIQVPSNDFVYEVMTRDGFRPGTEQPHRPTAQGGRR